MRSGVTLSASRRARVLVAAGLMALALPHPADGQAPTRIPRLGILMPGMCPGDTSSALFAPGFLASLESRGYVPGQTVRIECRASETLDAERFRVLAAELVRLPVDVLFTVSCTATLAVRPATSTIPVVALDLETDPVASGLAAQSGPSGRQHHRDLSRRPGAEREVAGAPA